MMRGTVLRLYRCGQTAAWRDDQDCDRAIDAWVDRLMAFSPSGRLEIVQALNASRELLDIACPMQRAGVYTVLLHTAQALRKHDHTAAHLIRQLPLLVVDGTPAHAAFSMVARGAKPTAVSVRCDLADRS